MEEERMGWSISLILCDELGKKEEGKVLEK